MLFYLLGTAGFIYYGAYDYFTVAKPESRFCRYGFWVGTGCTIAATLLMLLGAQPPNTVKLVIGSAIVVLFLALEIYTLFFALPFQDTYASENRRRRVCRRGVYALCRHPGVLWFIGLYAGVCVILGTAESAHQGGFLCLLNLIYVIFQDFWTFPKTFSDYGEYKKTVPFLIPNARSTKACRKDILSGRK